MAGSTCSGEADTRALETTLTLTLYRAHISHYDGSFGMAVRRCFSFSDVNTTVELVDGRGCPDPAIMSQFSYDSLTGTAQAKLFSMFKFPESNRVHFQCDIVICKGMQCCHGLMSSSLLQESVPQPRVPPPQRPCPPPRPAPWPRPPLTRSPWSRTRTPPPRR